MAGKAVADLHLHSSCSDGMHTPAEVVGRASRVGVRAISLTDHDTTGGTAEAAHAAALLGIEVVSGVEMSALSSGRIVHILGYFVAPHAKSLSSHRSDLHALRRDRIGEILDRLRAVGIVMDVDAVDSLAADAMPGRPHVARALVRHGYAGSTAEAFRRWLRDDGPAAVPLAAPDVAHVVERVHAAGGVAILAHPSSSRATDEEVSALREVGLDGIETSHPELSERERRRWSNLARRLEMVESGGSDDHGVGRKRAIGQHSVPMEWVDRLRARRPS